MNEGLLQLKLVAENVTMGGHRGGQTGHPCPLKTHTLMIALEFKATVFVVVAAPMSGLPIVLSVHMRCRKIL